MMETKKKSGRPEVPPNERRVHVTARIRPDLIAWMDSQGQRGNVIEAALLHLKASRLGQAEIRLVDAVPDMLGIPIKKFAHPIQQLAFNYARAHEEALKALVAYQDACKAMMHPFDRETGEQAKRFEEVRCNDGYVKKNEWLDTKSQKPVDDPADLEIISRWREAHKAKLKANRRLGDYKAAFLRFGKQLLKECGS